MKQLNKWSLVSTNTKSNMKKSFNITAIFFLLIIASFCIIATSSGDAPCEYTNSDVTCENAVGKFLEKPRDQKKEPRDQHILYIINSDISEIRKEDFLDFPFLETVFISESSIIIPTHEYLFKNIYHLKELRIEHCLATEKVKLLFAKNNDITSLILPGNKISIIKNDFLGHLHKLKDINLSQNEIEYIEVGLFERLNSLRTLNLQGNRLGSYFDPQFLTLESSSCFVCRGNENLENCGENDESQCKRISHIDQLWWKTHSVDIILVDNPVCAVILGSSPKQYVTSRNTFMDKSFDVKKCIKHEPPNCFKHKSREMFLLEACGGDGRKTSTSQPDLSPESTEQEGQRRILVVGVSVATLFIVLGIIIGGFAASRIDYFKNKKQNSTKKHQYEPIVNTQTTIEVEVSLHEAARRGDVNEVKNLLQQVKDPNELDKNGDTPLHIAALENQVEILDTLLKYNTDVNVANSSGGTPLIKAANKENCEAIRFLLEHGANKDASDSNGNTALHNAAYNGNRETLKILLEKGANIEIEDQKGKTPLYQASFAGHHDIVKLLLERDAAVNTPDHEGKTPLHIASWSGHQKVVDLLLQGNDEVNRKDKKGYTPLHNCSRKGHIEVLKHLLQKNNLDINITDGEGNTPLHHAASGGSIEVLNILLEKEADPNKYNKDNKNPLMVAEEAGNQVFAKKLKQRLRTNPASVHSN